jgi:hypothetical protein
MMLVSQGLADRAGESLNAKRFLEKNINPLRRGLVRIEGGTVSRAEDDGDIRTPLSTRRCQCRAGQERHGVVRDQQGKVVRCSVEGRQTLLTAGGDDDFVAQVRQYGLSQVGYGDLIIDKQNPLLTMFPVCLFSPLRIRLFLLLAPFRA